jgi:pSer/pThr/pTyr-binding forkhead associated (FHA) protein
MVYGRLDVYYPDGPSESFQLEKASVGIGRSSGNDIMLDVTSVSRYHIKITYDNNQAYVSDLGSVNGTYLDGERMRAEEPYPLRGGEEIQIGDLRLIFQPSQTEQSTQPAQPVNARQAVAGVGCTIDLEPIKMPVTPGAHVQTLLTVTNTGPETERFYIEVTGIPREWVRVDRIELELAASYDSQITINFKPLRRSDSKPGDYPITVRVRPKSQPEQFVETTTTLTVLSYNGFGIAFADSVIQGRKPFTVYLHNQGSGTLNLKLSGKATDPGLSVNLMTNQVTLAAGERQTITGIVRGRSKTPTSEIHVLAKNQDASGYLVGIPCAYMRLPGGGIGLFGLLFAMLAILAGVLVTIFTRVPPPEITSFSAQTPVLLRNVKQTIRVNWEVKNAKTVTISGLDSFIGAPSLDTYQAADSAEFTGLSRDPQTAGLQINLLAANESNEKTGQSIIVPFADPQCDIVAGTASGRTKAGPGAIYADGPALATSRVSPDRKADDDLWVRLASPAELKGLWLPAEDVACIDFAVADLLAIEADGVPVTPTFTPTFTATFTATYTATFTPTFTATFTPTFTPTYTPTFTATPTFTITPSNTPSRTPSNTPTLTSTPTATFTVTPSSTPTLTNTPTPTNTATPTLTLSTSSANPLIIATMVTATSTVTPSNTPTHTATPSSTHTPTITLSVTPRLAIVTESPTPTVLAEPRGAIKPPPSRTPRPAQRPTERPTQIKGP